MYRQTRKAAARIQWRPEPCQALRPDAWKPPELRRRITIEDFDGVESKVHVIELHRTDRIDCYRAVVNGVEWQARIGWSRVLDRLREAMPRLASPKHFTG